MISEVIRFIVVVTIFSSNPNGWNSAIIYNALIGKQGFVKIK
jgi:hypothetical protein